MDTMTNTMTTLRPRRLLPWRLWQWVTRNRRRVTALHPDMLSERMLRDIGVREIDRITSRTAYTHRATRLG
jgi:uncharacterized protein YjiS (DUF1127 family)